MGLLASFGISGMAVAPGIVRVGAMRFSVFGLVAAAGLIAAIALSQRTAGLAGLSAQKLWDAGVFAVMAALVISRVLLVVEDPQAFRRYPLLVLALPSLTYAGMALTMVAMLAYLRLKKLPVSATLDAWTPCAAVLGAALSLGHFLEGTDAGMPTSLPWGMVTAGDTVLGRVHPVQLYLLLAAAVLFFAAMRALRQPHVSGAIAGWGMGFGGAAFFLLDMLGQPAEAHGAAWLDPGQWMALACVALGTAVVVWATIE